MSSMTMNLFLLGDLQDVSRTGQLTAISWRFKASPIGSTISGPSLTRTSAALGPSARSCPDRWSGKVLWLAPEHVADKSETDVVELVSRYKRVLQQSRPTSGDDER